MPGSGAQATLKASNVPVAPLVLHGVVDGGDHLPSGAPARSFASPFSIKKKNICCHEQDMNVIILLIMLISITYMQYLLFN